MTASLRDVADRLVACCRNHDTATGLAELYHPDCVSVEPFEMPGGAGREFRGVDAIRAKHDWWNNTMEEHASTADGPYLHGDDRFGVIFEVDATDRSNGKRMQMKEIGIYHVRDGKIVREEFFFSG